MVIVEDINLPLSITDKTIRKKEDLKNTINQPIWPNWNPQILWFPTKLECIFSDAYGIFSKVDHMLCQVLANVFCSPNPATYKKHYIPWPSGMKIF